MGRPRDEFAWKQVEVSNDGWKCKYCKEDFKGSASRIRNHLSGQGNDISACEPVPEQIRNEASKKVTRKRGRHLQSSSSSTPASLLQDPPPSSSNDPVSFKTRFREELVTDAFIKFLMCNNSSSAIKDFTNDPYFREFLERAHKYGVPSSLLRGGSLVVEKSMFNINLEVRQYMSMVTESWKTTSCTCIIYYVHEEKQQKQISATQNGKYVYGFYCPKGFIFVEGPDPDMNYGGFVDALWLHSPRLDILNVAFAICHHLNIVDDDDLGKCGNCEFNDDSIDLYEGIMWEYCLREEIHRICIKVCRSPWAQGLINKAIQIHEICKEHWEWYGKLLTKNGMGVKLRENIKPTETSVLSNFLSIMLLQYDIKEKFLYDNDVGDRKFWNDGEKLGRVLKLILKIPVVMDTLVPTVGYLGMAIDAVKDIIFRIFEKIVEEDARVFFQDLDSRIKELSDNFNPNWKAARYLNPVYFLQHEQGDPDFHNKVCDALKYFCDLSRHEVNEELKLYGNVFSNLPANIDLTRYHPVKLWEKYGHDLPILRKLAINLLGQPVTCMCNQVKKHMYELQGADDFILRLNVRMMEEFKLLGDDIYKPIDIIELCQL